MKKLFLLLAVVGMMFTACEAGGGLDEDNNGNPAEQPDDNQGEKSVFVIDNEGVIVVEAKGGTEVVNISTNLEYSVEIPEEASAWLSVADTRAIRMEKLTFTIAKNEADAERSTIVKLLGNDNAELQNITFIQKGASASDNIGAYEIKGVVSQIIKTSSNTGSVTIDFEYDDSGNLITFKYGDEHFHQFVYSNSQILCGDIICTLTNNKITSVCASDWLNMKYTYNDEGYIYAIQDIQEEYTMLHIWDNENIVKIAAIEDPNYYCTVAYNSVHNNINIDLNRIVTMSNPCAYTTVRGGDTEYVTLCLYAMGFIGPKSRTYITEIHHSDGDGPLKQYNYEWEYDDLSRPKICKTKSHSGYLHTYTIKYKED